MNPIPGNTAARFGSIPSGAARGLANAHGRPFDSRFPQSLLHASQTCVGITYFDPRRVRFLVVGLERGFSCEPRMNMEVYVRPPIVSRDKVLAFRVFEHLILDVLHRGLRAHGPENGHNQKTDGAEYDNNRPRV